MKDRRTPLTRKRAAVLGTVVLLAAWAAFSISRPDLSAAGNTGVITGTVTSVNGAEAGVWVIAETALPTKFRKIVVTNDQGRFVLPDLPGATYTIWVRGYGLVDSPRVNGKVGQNLRLAAAVASTPLEAARVYPASYWVSLLEPPRADLFPGTGVAGNGISPAMKTQRDWINNFKACERCHQLGTRITREIPAEDMTRFGSSAAAWDYRVKRGQRGALMTSFLNNFPREHGLQVLAAWTDRIAAGAAPPSPPRPSGIERNVVLTMWNIATNTSLVHDVVASDKRNPRLYPHGPIYGVDIGMDLLTIVDPLENTSRSLSVPIADDEANMTAREFPIKDFEPFRFWGNRVVWKNIAGPHNPMFDGKGRVWLTTASRGPKNPAWCWDPAVSKYAAYFPLEAGGKQTGYFDTKTGQFVLIDTCVRTHHLQFAEDRNNTLYFSSLSGQALGWLDTSVWDASKNAQAAHGWCPIVVDSNGDGKITRPWNEPGGTADTRLDTRVRIDSYGVIPSPVDHAVWGTPDEYPGRIFRLDRGSNPPETCRAEVYHIPAERGYRARGIDVDRHGVVWLALGGSASFASFDRRKCKVLNGPAADGRHCDDGWTFHALPGVNYAGTTVGTDFYYYNYVDQFNTLGLGENIPIATGSNSDSLIALDPGTGQAVTLRVPYPLGFYARGMDGRIDDPGAGWKGRGIYSAYGADAHWHIEGGPAEPGNLVKFQIRPNPLAR